MELFVTEELRIQKLNSMMAKSVPYDEWVQAMRDGKECRTSMDVDTTYHMCFDGTIVRNPESKFDKAIPLKFLASGRVTLFIKG